MFSAFWVGKRRGPSRPSTPGSPVPGVFFCLLLALLAAPALAREGANCPAPGPGPLVSVARVADGDTFTTGDGRKVRLIGVNSPEIGRGSRPDQPGAREARRFVAAFVAAHPRLRLVAGADRRDNHGRHLAHVYTPDGQNLEAALLAAGLGWHVAVPPNLALADCLAAVEARARRQRLGLWRDARATSAKALRDGGFDRVAGRVTRVVFAKAWWINLDGKLAGVIYPEHQHRFSKARLGKLEGRAVVLRGWVYPSRAREGKPWRVKVETPHAIEGY